MGHILEALWTVTCSLPVNEGMYRSYGAMRSSSGCTSRNCSLLTSTKSRWKLILTAENVLAKRQATDLRLETCDHGPMFVLSLSAPPRRILGHQYQSPIGDLGRQTATIFFPSEKAPALRRRAKHLAEAGRSQIRARSCRNYMVTVSKSLSYFQKSLTSLSKQLGAL